MRYASVKSVTNVCPSHPKMKQFAVILCIALLCAETCLSKAAEPSTENPIYSASAYTTNTVKVSNGALKTVVVPGSFNPFYVMHLYGNATERGYAHGQLLADKIIDFVENELPLYYKEEIDGLDLGGLPEWLQKLIKSIGKGASGEVAKVALGYILKTQKKYLAASKANVFDEMTAIAKGVCSKIPNTKSNACKSGDATNLIATIEQVNMLPELIRMQCSMMGAWGKSTAAGDLLQLRTLDFGGGPFGNRTMLIVNHPEASTQNPAFATVGFPSFVGAVTGFSQNIGLCEKVDDATAPKKKPKGSYDGQADSFVIRDVIEFAKTKEDGISILKAAHRTWPIWIGLGDYASQEFNAMEYTREVVNVYNDQTLPGATNQTMFDDVAYIDKHPQPSPHLDMPDLVKQYYGTMTATNIIQNFPRIMESGDVHIALYDFGAKQAYIAVGTTNSTGSFVRKAYESPFIQFDMNTLWSEK